MSSHIRRRTLMTGAAGALAAPLILGRRASADDRSITVGIYTGPQGEVVRKQIIPPFEAKHGCKVYTTQGVTLEQVALMRASRNNPKYSVMFIDDIGVALAKGEGLIEKLPVEQIPNMERVLKRFIFYDGYGAAFAISAAGLAYNNATGKPLESYGDLWDPKLKARFLMETPKATQSLYLLIAAVSIVTGKPYGEAQYWIDSAWPKMEALKPNVMSIFDTDATTIMQVAQGQADVAGLFYSKSVNPYTVQGAPIAMCYPREGTFAGINTVTLVKNGPERELAIAFIDWMLSPDVQQPLAEQTLAAPSLRDLSFKPDTEKYMAYPESKMDEMGIFSPDWTFINPMRSHLIEKYNETFGA
ncbi:MAG TPA: extracellular solute-binding protein [Stellaceae bacterium]|nr:extracellular solute-binding protein [Stellaceae bacterium]